METLGKHFKNLASTAMQKHGFRQGDLLSHWSAIAGDMLAEITAPDRIKWPRNGPLEFGETSSRGATLVLRCNPGRALDVQYQIPQIIERVNQFFGYRAITSIKLIQAGTNVSEPVKRAARPPIASVSVLAVTSMIDNEDLLQALRRLGAHVERSRTKQLTDR
jgi:hypothetical protein